MEIIMTEMLWAVVLLVVGFVLLIKGADFFCGGKLFRGKDAESALNHYRTYDRGDGDKPSGMCGQYYGIGNEQ